MSIDQLPAEIELPTGEFVDASDIDAVIDAYEQWDSAARECSNALWTIRRVLAAKDEHTDQRTSRIQGRRRRVKLTKPDPRLNQAKLKKAWAEFPELRQQALRIERLALRKREFGKLERTSGNEEITAFVQLVESAIEPPAGLPRVEIEPDLDASEQEQQGAKAIEDSGLF